MLDYREQIQSIYEFLKRSETEQQYPYAYEIFLVTGVDITALTSRTSGTSKFNQDIESGVEKAKQSNGVLRVDVFGGKSRNANKLNSYNINVSGILQSDKTQLQKDEIQTIIREEISQIPNQKGVSDINDLLGMVTGKTDDKQGMNGLFGLFNAISGNNKELDRVNYQKQIDDFKFETRYNNLQDKYEKLRTENAELRVEKDHSKKENVELKFEVTDLSKRLEAYTPNELMKRTAIGVISNIGSKILGNSPKTAELFGLTSQELQGALGLLDHTSNQVEEVSNVEIEQVGNTAQTPEEKNKLSIIKNLSEALKTMELQQVAKIVNIVGLSIDKPELIDKTLQFLNELINVETLEEEN